MKKPIEWISKEVRITAIAETPNNYKIKTALGQERLRESLKSFGLAGTVVCNYAKKFGDINHLVLIDGNSRREEAIKNKKKTLWVSLPSRLLTPAEFREMSAMFDFAKAGEVDMDRIEKELGTTNDFYEKYRLEVPMDKLASMGANAPKGPKMAKEDKPVIVPDEYAVTLFYNKKQEALFRKMEERLKTKYKSISTSDTVLKALQTLTKMR